MIMRSKSILVVDPFEKMSKILIEELNHLGYNVIPLFENKMRAFDYSSCSKWDKLKNIFYRSILKDNSYYNILIEKFYRKYTEELLKDIILKKNEIDYVLVFRPHGFSEKFCRLLNKLTPEISLYEYDGLNDSRVLSLKKNQKYVKNVFLFECTDLKKIPSSKFITNYHYNLSKSEGLNSIDFYYLGVESVGRIQKLDNLINHTQQYVKKILVQTSNASKAKNKQVEFITDAIDYKDYLEDIKKTNAIIDIKAEKHNGLSFRFFEALNLEKKLITNNKSVVHYNFYHPDNIYITDFEDFDGLEEFLQKPYHPISPDIVKMYGLDNWIKNIFEIDDYIPIPNIPSLQK